MTRDAVPETCHPYGVQKEGGAASHVLQTCRSYGAIVFQKFSCTRLEKEQRVKRTFSYVVEQFDR